MPPLKTEAIILRKINFRETSVLLDIFTLNLGKIRGILKGVRTEKSKIPPVVFNPGCYIYTNIYQKASSGLDLMSNPAVIEPFIFSKREQIKLWHLILNLVNKFSPEREKSADIFNLLLKIGQVLSESATPEIIFVAFKINFVKILGYGVELNKCTVCSEKENVPFFSGKIGGGLCLKCKDRDVNCIKVAHNIMEIMRYFDRIPVHKTIRIKKVPALILEKINFYLNLTLHYHTSEKFIWWENEKNIFR